MLTSECFRRCETGGRMRAHEAVYVDVVSLELIQKTLCKPTLSIIAIDYQLSNPAYRFIVDCPMASECVAS